MMVRSLKNVLAPCLASIALLAAVTSQAADYLLVIDSSGSMSTPTSDGIRKIDAAKEALMGLRTDLEAHNVGVLLFSHRVNTKAAGCCQDIEFVLPIAPMSATRFAGVVPQLTPKGSTPLAESLTRANWIMQGRDRGSEKFVIVVTDGTDTCGGDPVAASAALRQLGINVTIHVVGFGVTAQESAQLKQIAVQGGGQFRAAENLKGLIDALETVIPVAIVKPQPAPKPAAKPAPAREPALPLSAVEKLLVARLQDKNDYVRQQAAKTLQSRKSVAAVPHLKSRVTDKTMPGSWASGKDAALNALKSLAPESVTPTLITALGSERENIRLWAAKRLVDNGGQVAKSGLSATDAALVKCLSDKDDYVRQQAATSLAGRKVIASVPHLIKRVGDDTMPGSWASAKDAALAAVKAMSPKDVENALVIALSSKQDNVRNWATSRLSTN